MKKIMFNDRYGLTEAVLQGRKTMTRRLCKEYLGDDIILADDVFSRAFYSDENIVEFLFRDGSLIVSVPPYKVGEVVAVAQAYRDCENNQEVRFDDEFGTKGWNNKMFVCADLMPNRIRFTDLKLEKLQDISDEDCMREGIQAFDTQDGKVFVAGGVYVGKDARLKIAKGMINIAKAFKTPQEAFAVLIDRVSGKGTWESNPYVFTYSFELVQKGGRK